MPFIYVNPGPTAIKKMKQAATQHVDQLIQFSADQILDEGQGTKIEVSPDTARMVDRAKAAGKGVRVTLEAEMIIASSGLAGNGFWSSATKYVTKAGKAAWGNRGRVVSAVNKWKSATTPADYIAAIDHTGSLAQDIHDGRTTNNGAVMPTSGQGVGWPRYRGRGSKVELVIPTVAAPKKRAPKKRATPKNGKKKLAAPPL